MHQAITENPNLVNELGYTPVTVQSPANAITGYDPESGKAIF
ncbi:hypothetical protein J2Z40_002380 [Cytobacillus eiseniae]|uniref:Uncharacterized protein n=1 Tax=Cytobacillus eiseniae TaxID=762947 RepID=A0ABS4RGB3_9BACI|nr:hypothetical protein [Cytobacillus eiseniae]MBP2241808.1 hypothetical protein [Cytobacillus eiseniae]